MRLVKLFLLITSLMINYHLHAVARGYGREEDRALLIYRFLTPPADDGLLLLFQSSQLAFIQDTLSMKTSKTSLATESSFTVVPVQLIVTIKSMAFGGTMAWCPGSDAFWIAEILVSIHGFLRISESGGGKLRCARFHHDSWSSDHIACVTMDRF